MLNALAPRFSGFGFHGWLQRLLCTKHLLRLSGFIEAVRNRTPSEPLSIPRPRNTSVPSLVHSKWAGSSSSYLRARARGRDPENRSCRHLANFCPWRESGPPIKPNSVEPLSMKPSRDRITVPEYSWASHRVRSCLHLEDVTPVMRRVRPLSLRTRYFCPVRNRFRSKLFSRPNM